MVRGLFNNITLWCWNDKIDPHQMLPQIDQTYNMQCNQMFFIQGTNIMSANITPISYWHNGTTSSKPLQANQTGSSNAMELEGAKRAFSFLTRAGLAIETFITDRHRGIAKWIRTTHKHTLHLFDVWHVARTVSKKVLKLSKESGCD